MNHQRPPVMLKVLGNILGGILSTAFVLGIVGGIGYALWMGGSWAFDQGVHLYYAGDRDRAIELAKEKHAAELRQLVEASGSKVTEVRGWEARHTDEPNVYLVLYKYSEGSKRFARFYEVNVDIDLVREVKSGTALGRKHDVLTPEERRQKLEREGYGDGTDLTKFLSWLREGKRAKLSGGGWCQVQGKSGSDGPQSMYTLLFRTSEGKQDSEHFGSEKAALRRAEEMFHDG